MATRFSVSGAELIAKIGTDIDGYADASFLVSLYSPDDKLGRCRARAMRTAEGSLCGHHAWVSWKWLMHSGCGYIGNEAIGHRRPRFHWRISRRTCGKALCGFAPCRSRYLSGRVSLSAANHGKAGNAVQQTSCHVAAALEMGAELPLTALTSSSGNWPRPYG